MKPSSARPPRRLSLVKREGPVSADSLAERLDLTAMAVRQHLAALAQDGLAGFAEQARPRGRPVQMWTVTPKANAHFADSHSALAADLVTQMKKAFGEDGIDRILKLRTAEQEKTYRAKTDAARSLKAQARCAGRDPQRRRLHGRAAPRCARRATGCSSKTTARSAPPPGSAPGCAARSSRCSTACWART